MGSPLRSPVALEGGGAPPARAYGRRSQAPGRAWIFSLDPLRAILLLIGLALLIASASAATSDVRVVKLASDGKTVIAECTLTEETVRRVLKTTVDDLTDLAFVGTHGSVASGMQSVAFTPATAIAALFVATGQDVGMVGTSSMAHGTAYRVEGGLHATIRLPGLEVATIGGGTTLPSASAWLGLMGCAGPAKVYRFAQIVAAATLALEISASAAMATAGSENFYLAHFERGGLR
jgi:hydroxymethylglutaryl-CoA reductase